MSLLSKIENQLENKEVSNIILNGYDVNKYKLDIENTKKWIISQKEVNNKLGEVAEAIISTNKFITYEEMVENIKITMGYFFSKYSEDYVILSEKSDKSGYVFTLLWILLCKKSGNKLPNKVYYIDDVIKWDKKMVYITVNDMDYSGNSTKETFLSYDIKIPKDIRLVLIRAYITTHAVRHINKVDIEKKEHYSVNKDNKNITIIFSCLLYTYEEQLIKNYGNEKGKELFYYTRLFWGGWDDFDKNFMLGITNIILEYKLADSPSTLLQIYTLGLVPSKESYGDNDSKELYIDFEKIKFKDTKADFFNLISGCEKNHKKIVKLFIDEWGGNIRDVVNNDKLDHIKPRCPYSWYKQIDWNTGIVRNNKD